MRRWHASRHLWPESDLVNLPAVFNDSLRDVICNLLDIYYDFL